MSIVEKVTKTRYTLKEVLSNEWDTSVMPDLSNNEVEKMYTLPSSKNKQIAQFGVASACNFTLEHRMIHIKFTLSIIISLRLVRVLQKSQNLHVTR